MSRGRPAAGQSRASDRPERTPLGQRNRLTFKDKDPNYVYRVINDIDDRLMQAQEGGYEFVHGTAKLGDERAAEAGAVDTRISKPVGGGVRGFLMRIPRDYYEDDQKAKQDKVDDIELAMKPAHRTAKEALAAGPSKGEIPLSYGELTDQ